MHVPGVWELVEMVAGGGRGTGIRQTILLNCSSFLMPDDYSLHLCIDTIC